MSDLHDPSDAIGSVSHYFGRVSVAAVHLTAPLVAGDRIHIRGHSTNLVQTVESTDIEHRSVEQAGPNDDAALETAGRVREHDLIYREP